MGTAAPVERVNTSALTRVSDLAPSPHLSGEDVTGRDGEFYDLDLTIKSWDVHAVGEQEEMKSVLFFEERRRGLVMNRTNTKMLAKLHGNVLSEIIGKRITVYFNPDIQYGGKATGGMRIRAKVPADKTAPAEKQEQVA